MRLDGAWMRVLFFIVSMIPVFDALHTAVLLHNEVLHSVGPALWWTRGKLRCPVLSSLDLNEILDRFYLSVNTFLLQI